MPVVSVVAVVVRPSSIVIRSVIWITAIIAVIAARVITRVSPITVVAVTVCRITNAESDASHPD